MRGDRKEDGWSKCWMKARSDGDGDDRWMDRWRKEGSGFKGTGSRGAAGRKKQVVEKEGTGHK